jgi:hypothetical protein
MKSVLSLTAACALLAGVAHAGDWEKLGSRQVDFGLDKDEIRCAHEGRFNAIKIDVDDGNLEMYNLRIEFANGEHFSPDIRYKFGQGERSRTIDMPGDARVIKSITFLYSSKLRKGRATVTVYGRGPGAEPGPDKEKPVDNDKWELLGIRLADFEAEKDAIEVTAREGRFNAIKLEVDAGNLDLWNVRVDFGNGEHFSPDTRLEFREGSMSRTIDLPGDARVIHSVTFWYKSELKKGKARIKLYGRSAGGGGGGGGGNEAPKWEKLGSRQVDFIADKDVIEVGGVEGRFSAIRIDVEEGNLDMWNVRVVFENDEDYSPDTRIEFRQGSMSRVIDLPGEARKIRKISFLYKSEFKKGRATVHVFGKHAAAGGGGEAKDPAKRKDPKDRYPGWEHLGTRIADYGADKDTIDCRGEGRFSSFQVEVEEGDLEMFDIKVTFGNGETANPATRLVFDDSSRTRVIDLPGKDRFIKTITFKYRSIRASRDGKAVIHVYGKK